MRKFLKGMSISSKKITGIQLDAGVIQVRIQLDDPPVFGRITNLRQTAQ